jgi:type I restriction enzyme, S subunit
VSRLASVSNWRNVRLRDVVEQHPTLEQRRALANAQQVSFLPMEAIGEQGALDLSIVRDKELVQAGYTLFFEGDVLVAKITPCFENGKGAIASNLLNGVGFGTTELHVLRPSSETDPRFLYYITASQPFRAMGEANMTGAAGQKRVPTEFVYNFRISLPPLATQRAIAAYLDRETAKIDAMIDAKQRLLALLAEKRRALITHAVTRGLDPAAPMRDSGVPWIGEVPAHWEVSLLRYYLVKIEQGWSPQSDNFPADEEEWGVLKVGAVNNWEFNPKENKRLPSELEPLSEYEIKPGDILISRANTTELLGSAVLVEEVRSKLLLCDKIYRLYIRENQIYPKYLIAYLRSSVARFSFERDASGASSSMQNISQSAVADLIILVPPLTEQIKISQYIEIERTRIELLESTAKQTIDMLQERRAALIAAAVTGQITIAS